MFLASFGLSFHFGFGAFDQEGDFRNRWMFSRKCGITEGEMRAIIAVSNLRPNPFFPRNALVISRTRWWIDPALTDTMFFLWIMTQFARQSVGCKPKTAIATAHLGIVYVDHAPASINRFSHSQSSIPNVTSHALTPGQVQTSSPQTHSARVTSERVRISSCSARHR